MATKEPVFQKSEAQPTQKFIEIEAVKNGVVILKDGGLRQLLLVSGVNFDLKSEQEKTALLGLFQNFLNSVDFPIQIFSHSRKVNINAYLEKLAAREQEEGNELLKTQIGEYREFIRSFVKENAIMQKSFFVTVPYAPIKISGGAETATKGLFSFLQKKGIEKPTERISLEGQEKEKQLEAHIEQLNRRVNQIASGLSQMDLRAVPLNDEELIELFYNLYNPETVEKKGLQLSQSGPGIESRQNEDDIRNIIAPAALEVNSSYIKLGDKYAKTFFLFSYPRYLSTGWLSPMLNLPELIDISIHINPVDTALALKNLRKKTTQIQAQIAEEEEKGMVRNPVLETALRDVESLRDTLQQGQEMLFSAAAYITVYADDLKALAGLENTITSSLESKLVYAKTAIFQQLEGFNASMPLGKDALAITNPMNSGPLSSFFPFVSANLTSEDGIMYCINRHNNSLVIFDRFSLENSNMVIFAKSGSGKSYTTKLEALRLLMTGVDIIIIDPENEYERLADAVGGSFFRISLTSGHHINPFAVPIIPKGDDPADVLRSHIIVLTGLLKIMLGKLETTEESLLDRAITETYASREIVPGKDFSRAAPPLLEDLQSILENMEGGRGIAERLYKFTKGSFSGFMNSPTNVDIKNRFIVFSIRDLEDELRPIAMYIILNFIWNLVRAELKKRVMIIDEAWWMMKYEDGASFLFGLVKRARKYFLGVTTITQDVEDFMRSPYGRPIITNSALQILLKQAPAMIDTVGKTFNLTEGEKNLLVEVEPGQGLFFAGLNRAAIQIVASYAEDKVITTKPEQILEGKK